MKNYESIKRIGNQGREYWLASELGKLMEYDEKNFQAVINRAIRVCQSQKLDPALHFAKMRNNDTAMSRFGCFLAAENVEMKQSDSLIARAYFATISPQQEICPDKEEDLEAKKRLRLRAQVATYNKILGSFIMNKVGNGEAIDFSLFHDGGYEGLYNGQDRAAIHERKELKKSHNILDYMNSAELAANFTRMAVAESELEKLKPNRTSTATRVHFDAGKSAREAIKIAGGLLPEHQEKPAKSIAQIGRMV